MFGLAVAHRVGQGFLHDAVDACLHRRGQRQPLHVDSLERGCDAMGLTGVDDHLLQRGHQAHVVEVGRTQVHGQAVEFLQHAVGEPLELVDLGAPTLDLRHKLKLAVPIIPWLLTYEGEVDLGNHMGLEAAWQALVTRFRGRNP